MVQSQPIGGGGQVVHATHPPPHPVDRLGVLADHEDLRVLREDFEGIECPHGHAPFPAPTFLALTGAVELLDQPRKPLVSKVVALVELAAQVLIRERPRQGSMSIGTASR